MNKSKTTIAAIDNADGGFDVEWTSEVYDVRGVRWDANGRSSVRGSHVHTESSVYSDDDLEPTLHALTADQSFDGGDMVAAASPEAVAEFAADESFSVAGVVR
jgi:hypothetical protein